MRCFRCRTTDPADFTPGVLARVGRHTDLCRQCRHDYKAAWSLAKRVGQEAPCIRKRRERREREARRTLAHYHANIDLIHRRRRGARFMARNRRFEVDLAPGLPPPPRGSRCRPNRPGFRWWETGDHELNNIDMFHPLATYEAREKKRAG